MPYPKSDFQKRIETMQPGEIVGVKLRDQPKIQAKNISNRLNTYQRKTGQWFAYKRDSDCFLIARVM